jgi:hypothetical protein
VTVALGLLTGCDVPGLTSPAGAAGSSTSSATPSAGPTWSIYQPGQPQTSPDPFAVGAAAAATPNITLPPLAALAPMATTSPKQLPDPCGGRIREGAYKGLEVTPAVGAATVAWLNAGDSSVKSYRVAAVPQELVVGSQPALNWVQVAPGTGCATVSTSVGGLTSGGHYIFWLNAVYQVSGETFTHDRTVAVSSVVAVL